MHLPGESNHCQPDDVRGLLQTVMQGAARAANRGSSQGYSDSHWPAPGTPFAGLAPDLHAEAVTRAPGLQNSPITLQLGQ